MTLFCSVCHTRWTEACFDVYDKCPLRGCGGRLTVKPPKVKAQKARPVKKPEALPLLKAAGLKV